MLFCYSKHFHSFKGGEEVKKFLVIMLLSIVPFFSIATATEVANVSPSTPTIRGSSAEASWIFTWGLTGPVRVRFNPDDGSGGRTIDSSNTSNYFRHSYRYVNHNPWTTYTPNFTATRLSDHTAVGAYATVHQRLP